MTDFTPVVSELITETLAVDADSARDAVASGYVVLVCASRSRRSGTPV